MSTPHTRTALAALSWWDFGLTLMSRGVIQFAVGKTWNSILLAGLQPGHIGLWSHKLKRVSMDQNSRKWAFNDLKAMLLISNQQCPKTALRGPFPNKAIIQTDINLLLWQSVFIEDPGYFSVFWAHTQFSRLTSACSWCTQQWSLKLCYPTSCPVRFLHSFCWCTKRSTQGEAQPSLLLYSWTSVKGHKRLSVGAVRKNHSSYQKSNP